MAVGLVGVLPQLAYDFSFSNYCDLDIDKKTLFKNAYIINTFNNIIGFGGLVYFGLRLYFYSKYTDKKESVSKTIIKIAPYEVLGLSILAGMVSLVLLIKDQSPYVENYIILLALAPLYALGLFLISKYKKASLFSGLSKKFQLEQGLSSLGEWIGVIVSFIIIGRLMKIEFNLIDLVALQIIANIIGMTSQIPGGLGSYDLVMLTGLSSFGIDKELAASWLILYRLSSYILPFLISSLLFLKYLFVEAKTDKSEMLKDISYDLVQRLNSICIVLYGVFLILTIVLPSSLVKIPALRDYSMMQLRIIDNVISTILGFIFLLMGRLALNRQEKFTRVFIPLAIITILYQVLSWGGTFSVYALVLMIILALLTKKQLFRKQFIYGWEEKSLDSIFTSGVLALAIFNFNDRIGINSIIHGGLGHGLAYRWAWFLGLILILFSIRTLIMTYMYGGKKIGQKPDLEEFSRFIEEFGSRSLDAGLTYLEDKDIYYYENEKKERTVAIQFASINNKLVVMGDPFGKEEDIPSAINKFIEECDLFGYRPIFYEVGERTILFLHEYGYGFMKFGEAAFVSLNDFSLAGPANKASRNVLNRFEKEGYSFSLVEGPHSPDLIDKLEKISKSWLGDRSEKGFSLGFFKRDYLSNCKLALVEDTNEEPIAFANIMPVEAEGSFTIDLMRYDPDKALNSTMDYLFINLFLYGQENKKQEFYMGMAPLSEVGTMKTSYLKEKIAYMVYKHGNKFYSFKGLRKYKEKYATYWKPLYTSYAPGNWILYSLLAIFIIDQKKQA